MQFIDLRSRILLLPLTAALGLLAMTRYLGHDWDVSIVQGVYGIWTLRIGHDWDTFVAQVGGTFIAGCWSLFLALKGWEETRQRENEASIPQPQKHEPLQYNDLNKGTEYALTTNRVTVNVEQQFARELMRMWREGEKVELTEKYWIKGGHWKAIGGTSRETFVEMLSRWDQAGSIARANPSVKNSPYIIVKKSLVAQAAAGRQL